MDGLLNLLQKFAYELAVLALPIISGFIIAALRALVKKWLQELQNSKPDIAWYLDKAVEIAVAAAEKMEVSGLIKDKKEYAMNVAQKWLDEHGWTEVDVFVLEAAIEAEVLKQFGREPRSAQ